jgi:hypothetical protein
MREGEGDPFKVKMMKMNWTFSIVIFIHMVALASPRTFNSHKTFVTREKRHTVLVTRNKRHTPFLPGDYWKDNRPGVNFTNILPAAF